MGTDRFFKISVWIYVAGLLAVTLAHFDWPTLVGDPLDIYRIIALSLAGLLARLAYPNAPSFAFLMMIGTVSALGLAHALTIGNDGRPLDIIVNMASGMWGVVLGAAADRLLRMPSALRRSLID
jgi:hypothetical protein